MKSIRNIAIIAHVDHGKTTLVDRMIESCNVLSERDEREELILDNNDLERERGITIVSKNVSVNYKGTKINICSFDIFNYFHSWNWSLSRTNIAVYRKRSSNY